ncbi:putative voltage-gated K+ channel beta subunit (KCNAB) [Aspergillus aculeatinus CBS 121060]|uniref:Voltage-gated potassium channel subunit beta n=2 Tax=Aspergillus subgen. Circumdati TaxID=2720871 RepID=A0ACD1HI37_9EURO|nr:voltage-gated potassium channel subunit beta [Aspergillus brunneoviolaceus CBS 621.78]XP_025507053.1 voltage-gated potassium channel subunit beta [Aspergillus aculeatinus CBS 121060]RAH41961.1 voltage-gated potassium channel subunit beta [Aspergillus brunneoviolaceus CBS 621.78]RAH73230.1 voltage-gated potassium channel subunit beta [Aspergillus aculeatinus CBS 121060]
MAWPNKNKDMLYRRVGNSGLHVSALGLGGWLTFGGHVDNEITFQCMKQAYDCGINFFDTAESYAGGQSEIVMGQAIKKFGWKRSDLVISTKLNWGLANGEILINNHGLSRKHIVEGTRASLERLQLEYVDIIYAHRPDRLTPMEETVRAFNHVIEKGWAFYWGTSEWSADEISEACGIARALGLIAPVVEQPQYNMLTRQKVEGQFQRLYARCGIGLTVFSPLKMGLLSGKYNEATTQPPPGSRFAESNDKYANYVRSEWENEWAGTIRTVQGLQGLADKLGVKLSQLALAWCLKNENVSSVITGASRPEQIVDNVESLKLLPRLTPEVMAEIDEYLRNAPEQDPARQD